MMSRYRSFTGNEPEGTIVVRVVEGEAGPRAYIKAVAAPDDIAEDSIEQSEELPVDEALALARNKAANIEGGAEIVIDLGPKALWHSDWGVLE